uniref:small ribosomal subunit protein mS38 isoform X2 n=1 Tax=Myxine glutinosa TaxID=7769 RepID=UPI00358F818C
MALHRIILRISTLNLTATGRFLSVGEKFAENRSLWAKQEGVSRARSLATPWVWRACYAANVEHPGTGYGGHHGLLGGTLGKQVHGIGAEVGEKLWRFKGSDERWLKRWENGVGEKCGIPGVMDTEQLNKFGVSIGELLEGFESKQRWMGTCLGIWDLGLQSSQEACLVLTALQPNGNLQRPDEIQARNVLKIRRRKMKHHQYKRWLKRTKFQRRKRDHFVRVRKQKRFEEELKEILKKTNTRDKVDFRQTYETTQDLRQTYETTQDFRACGR